MKLDLVLDQCFNRKAKGIVVLVFCCFLFSNPSKLAYAEVSYYEAVTLQQALRSLGFLNEKPDGYFGQRSRAAAARFQSKIGSYPSGELTSEEKLILVSKYLRKREREMSIAQDIFGSIIDAFAANAKSEGQKVAIELFVLFAQRSFVLQQMSDDQKFRYFEALAYSLNNNTPVEYRESNGGVITISPEYSSRLSDQENCSLVTSRHRKGGQEIVDQYYACSDREGNPRIVY